MALIKLSFAKRKLFINRAKFWSLIILLGIFLYLDLWWLIEKIVNKKLPHLGLFQFVVILILIGLTIFIANLIINKLTKMLDPIVDKWKFEIDIAKKGDRGEEMVFLELKNFLYSDQYTIFRNVVLPGRKSDIDFIIVGPKGLVILEIKNYSTKTVFTKNRASYYNQFGFLRFLTRDHREVLNWQAEGLEKFLFFNEIDVSPLKALVFIDPASIELKDYENSYGVYVVRGINELKNYFDNLFENKKFTIQYCTKICSVLETIKAPDKFEAALNSANAINFMK